MAHDTNSTPALQVEVTDARGSRLTDATVEIHPVDDAAKADRLSFDERLGKHVAGRIGTGDVVVTVEHPSLEGQSRTITVGQGPNEALFMLGEPGGRSYFRESVRVPVDADGDLIAVTLDRKSRTDGADVDSMAATLQLRSEPIPALASRAGLRLFRSPTVENRDVLARLSEHSLVQHAGAVVSLRETGFSHLTRDVVVRFRGPRAEEVRAIAKRHGYDVVRELVYAPHTWVLRWNQPATLEILDSIEELAARDDVQWAEPSLVVSPEMDSITPNDTLWPGLWDRQLIGVQDAWQSLQDAGLPTFGDPDILFAVWDSGVQQSGGVPTNADFSGTLSNGSPKVFTSFDFDTMVANNDNPWDDHGSGVAGVSVAMANNASPVAAEGYGLTGSAPNVQMMCIAGRLPYIDIEVADQYIWMAGFNPVSPLAGFPAPLSRGADVITCSLTPGAGAPLSGTAKATLDFVTTFGRQGKGTLCFFSTGNANQNNVTARPYGAYEKCFGIAGTSFADDGVTEIRAPYSGWGQIALSAPTQDQAPTVHNPPTGYMPWGAAHAGQGNLISYRQVTSTTTAAAAAGATTLTLASVTGLAINQVIHVGVIGALGSEPARITAINVALNQLTIQGFGMFGFGGGLLNAHPSGAAVAMGPANHRNDFGGTSSATPLCAGVGALVLSANPSLTYIEARQALRDSAVKFDLTNTDPAGQWLDANGDPSVTSGLPPVKSGWYGYGRVNAAGAVTNALAIAATRDLVIRDNLADTGTVASAGAFWNTPDLWCRRLSPATDPGALPAGYATAGPHQDPKRGQPNWVYARVHNNGTAPSLDGWVRVSVTHWPGTEFTWPASFQPTNGPGDPLPSPMTPGTYFIGEAKVTAVAPGAEQIVSIEWPVGLIPPETVMVGGSPVHWHPCLLAEVTPHDGPAATGNHVWDDNNLAQKNISIVDADAGTDFQFAIVVGNEFNTAKSLVLEVNRGRLPKSVELYVDLVDPILRRRLRVFAEKPGREPGLRPAGRWGVRDPGGLLTAPVPPKLALQRHEGWQLGFRDGREIVLLEPRTKVQLPTFIDPGRPHALVIGGIVGKDAEPGEYEVVLIQRQPSGRISGSATVQLTVGKG